mmetsp:Transcript_41165/g.97551  ORF Transcript_41165/g.97551 Transcript_41165/m.97551 type:complete len:250 (+) Transcript_41165:364-1113(+)
MDDLMDVELAQHAPAVQRPLVECETVGWEYLKQPQAWTGNAKYDEILSRLFNIMGENSDLKRGVEDSAANTSGVDVHYTVKAENAKAIKVARGEGIIRAPPHEVLGMLLHVERRPEWDDLCDHGSVVQQFGPCADIIYLSYQGKLGVCARDLCLLRAWRRLPDGSLILVSNSIETPDVSRVAGKVRAECHDCIYIITPCEDGCTFQYIIQLDMKGYVPLFFSNLIQTQHPLIISMLRRHLEDADGRPEA